MAKKKSYDFEVALDLFIHKALNEGVTLFQLSKAFKIESARIDAGVMEMALKASAKAVAESLL